MKPTCVDLRLWAKKHQYRWRWEASRQPGEDDAFLVEIVCRYGLIYPKGGDALLAYANRGVRHRVAKLGEHHQTDGNNEVFRFPVDRLDEVAAVLKPRRRRTLDPDRARTIGKGNQYGAQSTQDGQDGLLGAGEGLA